MACSHEALSYTRPSDAYGPTDTTTVTRRFEQRLRGVLGRLNAAIRRAIIENDLFGLQSEALVDDVPDRVFEFTTDSSQIRAFLRWVRQQLDENLLTVVQPNENQYLQQAYGTGLRFATTQLNEAGVPVDQVDVSELLERGQFARSLQTLYTRTYENLVSVRDDVVQAVREELTTGFAEGRGPTDIARSLTDRVNSIGKHRATLIARSEVINAHTEGTLDRYEQSSEEIGQEFGVSHVGRLTANDAQVCAFCRRLSDDVFTIGELRGTTVRWRGRVYRLAPPSHPNGRCAVLPRPGISVGELPALSERVPGTIVS